MFDAASIWGEEEAVKLVVHHKQNAGIDRVIKFHHFFTIILGRTDCYEEELTLLCDRYSLLLKDRLINCEEAPSLRPILRVLRDRGHKIFVASGAKQQELRDILSNFGLSSYFDGIFGAPDSKIEILSREISVGKMPPPRLFIGDSQYDWEAASAHDCEFLFVSDWSDFDDGEKFFAQRDVKTIPHLGHLMSV